MHFPEAFEEAKTIAIDARWLQTEFSEALGEWLQVAPYTRNIVGLEWDLVGDIVPHAENTFQAEMEGFLHLLTLKNKTTLNIDDLLGMLQTLGSVYQGHFKQACDLLTEVKVTEAPFNKGGVPGMMKHVYYLRFRDFDATYLPLVETFIAKVRNILDNWISEAKVEVQMQVSGLTE